MFEQLNKEKIMYFKDNKSTLTYQDAFSQLATNIGQHNISLVKLEKIILKSLSDAAISLNAKKKLTAKTNKILIEFYKWVQNIHNDNLAVPPNAAYPNNIVYDLLRMVRNQASLTAQETLLRFFLEGANGRKISSGQTPHMDFISTSLAIDVTVAMTQLTNQLSDSTNQFLEKYTSLANYRVPQNKLETVCAELKDNALYSFLSVKDIFNFKREKNDRTDANYYLLDHAITNGIAVLTNYQDTIEVVLRSMVVKLTTDINLIQAEFENARKQSTLEAYQLAKWDASEWLSRLYVALSIAVKYDARYQADLDILMKNNCIAEIISESKTGHFPAKMRNAALDAMEITELFTQQQLSILATKKAPVSSMWTEVSNTNNKNKHLSINIRMTNGKYLTIDQGEFAGNVEATRLLIQDFFDKNTVTFTTKYRGYGTLTINDTNYPITPYGIDLSMMLSFCGIEYKNTNNLHHA